MTPPKVFLNFEKLQEAEPSFTGSSKIHKKVSELQN